MERFKYAYLWVFLEIKMRTIFDKTEEQEAPIGRDWKGRPISNVIGRYLNTSALKRGIRKGVAVSALYTAGLVGTILAYAEIPQKVYADFRNGGIEQRLNVDAPAASIEDLASIEDFAEGENYQKIYGYANDYTNIDLMLPMLAKTKKNVPTDPAKKAVFDQLRAKYKISGLEQMRKESDEVVLARVIFGEIRGNSKTEKIAVGYTVVNRANDINKIYGKGIKGVCLRPSQYSCLNSNDANLKILCDPILYSPKEFNECLEVARGVIQGTLPSPIGKDVRHYHTPASKPKWSRNTKGFKLLVGNNNGKDVYSCHIFYDGLK
jgi:N-acetylmuramoyl-L-alanine amidase